MNEEKPRRLFLAVALDDDTRAGLLAHLEANGGSRIPGRHVVAANWHLTLRFLGAGRTDQRERLSAHLDEHLGGGAFTLRFDGLGAFPRPGRATVAWLGVSGDLERIDAIAAECEEAARAAGFPPEERPFHPHLTLSRIRPPEDMRALVAEFPPPPGRLEVDRVVLFESRLRGGPPEYLVVESFPV